MQSHKYQHKTKALRRQYEGNFLWDSVVLREKQWDSSARSSILLLYSDSAEAADSSYGDMHGRAV